MPAALLRVLTELKRRRVFGSIAAYVVVGALLIELSGAIFEALLFPEWASRLVTVLLILGLPVVAVLSWFFDISTEGIERAEESDPAARASAPTGTRAGLDAALQRSRSAPVPAEPVRRRRPAAAQTATSEAETPAGVGSTPADSARVREAALGHIRHELRTPINGIIGYSEMLLEDVTGEELVADLTRIREAGRQLLDRVDTLLLRDASPDELPEELESFAEQVRLDLRTPVSAVVGYAEMLLESCEEGGRDELVPDLERIRTSATRLLERSEDIVRLATQSDAAAGLGESEALTEQVLSKIKTVSGGALPEAEGRLLVVDDNETNRDLISRQLARFGYTVATAVDGKEALDRLQQEDFDLVLLDVIMPRMDGVETLTRLRQEDRLADTPVIMLSSLNELDSAVRCIEMGAADYIAKPVQASLLEARIAAALEVRDLRSREHAYRRRVEVDGALIERLLQGAFPGTVRERVREGTVEIRYRYPQATVVRAVYPAEHRPSSGPDGLDRIESVQAVARTVEELAADHGVETLLWRPDGFVAVFASDDGEQPGAGAPDPAGAAFALQVRDRIGGVAVGIHTGPVVAGVVGHIRPRFEVWGEGVDAADALADHAPGGSILVTPAVRSALDGGYTTEARGVKEIRGRGQMRIFTLVAADDDERKVPAG